MKQQNLKMNNDFNRHSTKEDMELASWKDTCGILLFLTEMQIKTRIRYHHLCIRISRKVSLHQILVRVEETGTHRYFW
jgi:hypothetical protein